MTGFATDFKQDSELEGYPKRGQICLVSLEPVNGHEIGKTRPTLGISREGY